MDIEVGENKYRIGQLSALESYHVSRRYADVLLFLSAGKDVTPKSAARAMVITSARLSQTDSDYVVMTCLAKCMRAQQGSYAPVCTNGTIMFDNLGFDEMMQLVYHVVSTNGLVSFFAAPVSTSAPAPQLKAGEQSTS